MRQMIKVLFLIHDLGQGGAEKVLVNLVNHLDKKRFDVTLVTLFAGGVNEQFLDETIHYHSVLKKIVPGNSKIMKLFSPEKLHSICIKEKYDIEISFLEGPSARIISGCTEKNTKLISWIHCEQATKKQIAAAFRNFSEAERCYRKFDKNVFVAEGLRKVFCEWVNVKNKSCVLYNAIDTEKIRKLKDEEIGIPLKRTFSMIAVGSLKKIKGYDRLLKIAKRLYDEKRLFHLYILGIGPMEKEIRSFISREELNEYVSLLGYDTNPYKYIARSDVFVCSSYSEGFSTATIEALITGTPVCTVEVAGMKEILGNGEYGLITKNTEEELYKGIKKLMDDEEQLEFYREKATERGKQFSLEKSVGAVEQFLEECEKE